MRFSPLRLYHRKEIPGILFILWHGGKKLLVFGILYVGVVGYILKYRNLHRLRAFGQFITMYVVSPLPFREVASSNR